MAIKKLENNTLPGMLLKIFLITVVTAGGIYGASKLMKHETRNMKQETNVLSVQSSIKKQITENKTVKNISQTFQDTAEDVLGEATKIVENAVSTGKEKAEDFVIKTAVDKVMEQVDKLPEKEQEKIKEEICK